MAGGSALWPAERQVDERILKRYYRVVSALCRMGCVSTIVLLSITLGCREDAKKHPGKTAKHGYIEAEVEAVNNPKQADYYRGPVGAVEGIVRVSGDRPPPLDPPVPPIPEGCSVARAMYADLFREGPGRALADVLVAVTGYQSHLPTKIEPVSYQGKGCAWEGRTIALTYGQSLAIRSADQNAYVPNLLGSQSGVELAALPNGNAVPVIPKKVGHFMLVDSMHIFAKADVFVIHYPTHDVTGLDGHYRIEGIPPGRVTVNALLPAINQSVQQAIEIKANETARCDLSIRFDIKDYQKRALAADVKPEQASQASPSVADAGKQSEELPSMAQ